MALEFELKGLPQMVGKLNKLSDSQRRVIEGYCVKFCEEVLADSKQNYVPVKHGVLRNSGHVKNESKKSTKLNQISIVIRFGGAARAYAISTHETPSKHDPPSWKGKTVKFRIGGSKYLEKPFMKKAEEFESGLQAAMESGVVHSNKPSKAPSGPRQRDSRGRFI